MKTNLKFYLILVFALSSCVTDDHMETYTIQGRLIDGTNPTNKFSYRKLKFMNELDHRNVETLGETTTDENGNFSISYEFSENYVIKFMRILIDTNIIAAKKLVGLEIGTNWNKNLYLGDSAIFNLYLDKDLGINDTLYFSNWDSLYSVIGPTSKGFIKTFKCLNYSPLDLIGYGINRKYYSQEQSIINFQPTGEPFVDELHFKIEE